MNKLTSALHDATHQVPGVPDHSENQLPHRPRIRPSNNHPRLQSPERHQTPQRHRKPPRVLIAWQNWIAERIGRTSRR